MRLRLLVLLAATLPPASSFAQEPAPWDARPDPGVRYDPRPTFAAPEASPGGWRVDLVAGLPIGFRAQVPLAEGERVSLFAEGTAGLYVIMPTVGVGLRPELTLLSGWGNKLSVAPGLGVYAIYNLFRHGSGFFGGGPDGWLLGAADVDISWKRCRGASEGELGVKIGCAAGTGGAVLPLVGLFAGWRW